MSKKIFSRFSWWEIALLSIAVSALGGLASMQSSKKDRKRYRSLKQAPWAPPAQVFAPAWTLNNFFLLLALQRILNSHGMERNTLLRLQIGIWVVFFTFGFVYFKKSSSVLGAVWTVADMVFAITSFVLAHKNDKKLANYYLPLVAWTGFASTLAIYQALENPDPVIGTKKLLTTWS